MPARRASTAGAGRRAGSRCATTPPCSSASTPGNVHITATVTDLRSRALATHRMTLEMDRDAPPARSAAHPRRGGRRAAGRRALAERRARGLRRRARAGGRRGPLAAAPRRFWERMNPDSSMPSRGRRCGGSTTTRRSPPWPRARSGPRVGHRDYITLLAGAASAPGSSSTATCCAAPTAGSARWWRSTTSTASARPTAWALEPRRGRRRPSPAATRPAAPGVDPAGAARRPSRARARRRRRRACARHRRPRGRRPRADRQRARQHVRPASSSSSRARSRRASPMWSSRPRRSLPTDLDLPGARAASSRASAPTWS